MHRVEPTGMLSGSTVGFALWIASTVVPNLLASKKNVSPGCTVYANVPGGQVGGTATAGMHRIEPIWMLCGSTVGFALWIASTVVPKRLASKKNVSPGCTVYANVPAGHVGGLGADTLFGMHNVEPTWMLCGLTVGLALWMASTVVPKRFARRKNVSPGLTVYANVPRGQVVV